jgi:hypothetical protein
MKKLIIVWVFSSVMGLFMSCGLNSDLFAPTNDSGRETEHRSREPEDDNPPPATVLFLPLAEGASWSFTVEYRQSSLESGNYSAVYIGEETCVCSAARFSDSTFVFQTRFSGKKTITSSSGVITSNLAGVAALVNARMVKGALVLTSEEGTELAPFWGDWLFRMKNQFKICFVGSQKTIEKTGASADLEFAYTLEQQVGLVAGSLTARTAYDVTVINYHKK